MPETDPRFDAVRQAAGRLIAGYLRLGPDELTLDSHIVEDLGADSLALVELGFQISETFGVPMLDTSGDKLIFRNLIDYILDNS
jgi:acyl carrier protein